VDGLGRQRRPGRRSGHQQRGGGLRLVDLPRAPRAQRHLLEIYQDIGVLFLTYDENDGFFDHMVPPTPPFEGRGQSTVDAGIEIFAGRPGNPRGPTGWASACR
jgi:hypothetical protein